ncbi:unnamed protein product [Nippostrongylus brasiliensis]|uniref:Transcription factor n=1 Tax=Nippostrongylus brasiliensis TaxID=27835 RepID=A0A0N4XMK6_NIPBR|nr:unnamed protein product [Nippostrongylus brasiliensis]
MVKLECSVLKDTSTVDNAAENGSRKRGRPRKRKLDEELIIKKELDDSHNSSTSSIPRKRGRPRKYPPPAAETPSTILNGTCTPDLSCSIEPSECSPSIGASANVSVCNYDIKPIITRSRAPPTPEFVDVHELWDHYVSRAEYHPILSSSEVQCPKARSRLQDRKVLVEKISQLKRIEQCVSLVSEFFDFFFCGMFDTCTC